MSHSVPDSLASLSDLGEQLDMDQFLDLNDLNTTDDTFNQLLTSIDPSTTQIHSHTDSRCPTHPDTEYCLCQNFINDFGFTSEDVATLPSHAVDAENYANFTQWIPRYKKPEKACDYCHAKGLDCYFTRTDQDACSCCKALFRQCSFSSKHAVLPTVMDTLSSVSEDICCKEGGLTGKIALRSWDRSALEEAPLDNDDKSRKSTARFSRAAIKVLKDWMDQHPEHPYPTEEEKEHLGQTTGLKAKQINDWMANTRRRTKTRAPRAPAPMARNFVIGTVAIDIPFDKTKIRHNGKTWDHMKPLERYLESPPENEPAPITIIAQNADEMHSSPLDSTTSSDSEWRPGRRTESTVESGSRSNRRPASVVTSLATDLSDSLRSSNSNSNLSLNSGRSQRSRESFNSLDGIRKERRRRRRTAANPGRKQPVEHRPFQCTFCTDTFRTKYDWARHEKSLHISLEKWVCSPLGGAITVSESGQSQCVFCGKLDPSRDHIDTHNYRPCEEKGLASRTFFRKDHLRQHLRLVHGCKMIDSMESWKIEANFIRSRCGFCAETFTSWSDRVEHIALHFKAGLDVSQWKGCRGLDPEVSAQITNAMPPYLIGQEAKSPLPFSASSGASMTHHMAHMAHMTQNAPYPLTKADLDYSDSTKYLDFSWLSCDSESGNADPSIDGFQTKTDMSDTLALPMTPRNSKRAAAVTKVPKTQRRVRVSTCWEVLTLRLGRYVKDQLALGITPSDAELQSQARVQLYGEDDPWNQTAADNIEWLSLFKRAHGIDDQAPVDPTIHQLTLNQQNLIENLGLGYLTDAAPAPLLDMNFQDVPAMTDAETDALLCSLMPMEGVQTSSTIDEANNLLADLDATTLTDFDTSISPESISPWGQVSPSHNHAGMFELDDFGTTGNMSFDSFTSAAMNPGLSTAVGPSGLSALFGGI